MPEHTLHGALTALLDQYDADTTMSGWAYSALRNDVALVLRAHPPTSPEATPPSEVRCDTCGDTGRIEWMIEGDPYCSQSPDDEGTLPCPDCATPPSETNQCRHGSPEGDCPSCAACAACRGECGQCPYNLPGGIIDGGPSCGCDDGVCLSAGASDCWLARLPTPPTATPHATPLSEVATDDRLAEKWLSASLAARKAEHHFPADCLAEAVLVVRHLTEQLTALAARLASDTARPEDVEREALAKAWDEGYRACSTAATSAMPNPYREPVEDAASGAGKDR